jgi:SnoaL-like domain
VVGRCRRVGGGRIPSIITDDVVGYWPGGRTVRGAEPYMQALEEGLALLPDLRLELPEHTMSPDGQFGCSRWVMHATGAKGPFELVGMDRTRMRDGRVCELRLLRLGPVSGTGRRRVSRHRGKESTWVVR